MSAETADLIVPQPRCPSSASMLKGGGAALIVLSVIVFSVAPTEALVNIFERRPVPADANNEAGNKCLKFMHIAKTGGTTMDLINLRRDGARRPFKSYMEEVFDSIANYSHQNAGNVFNRSHNIGGVLGYANFMTRHVKFYKWFGMSDGSWCTVHTPVSEPHARRFYDDDQCTVFCAVRDPFERFMSTLSYNFDSFRQGELDSGRSLSCTPSAISAFVVNLIKGLHTHPYHTVCHWVSQTEMIYGSRDPSSTALQRPYCQRILRYEHLEPEFDALMQEFGRSARLDEVPKQMSGTCKIDARAVSREAKDAIYEYYKTDFDLFGYMKP